MTIFGDYARYYDVLYQDKDYAGEADFVLSCLVRRQGEPRTLLDLGCGTGRHGLEMARRGVSVTGVDMSATMLEGDARTVRLDARFDAVTSLFHVMSYQNTEEDALAVLETARCHLKPGGCFFFDFWYGPGVLTDPPTERDRIMEDARTLVRRHARPVHRISDDVVDVHYDIRLTDKATGRESSLREVHAMRYWFLPELHYLARQAGFSHAAEGAWLDHDMLSGMPWNAWMLLEL